MPESASNKKSRIRSELIGAESSAARLAGQFDAAFLAKYPAAKVSWAPSGRGLILSVEGIKFPRLGRIHVQAITPDCAAFCHVHPGLGATSFSHLSDFMECLEGL